MSDRKDKMQRQSVLEKNQKQPLMKRGKTGYKHMGIHTAAILAPAPRKGKKAHVFLTSYAIIASLKALFWLFSLLYLTK